MSASWPEDRKPEKLFICQIRIEPNRDGKSVLVNKNDRADDIR